MNNHNNSTIIPHPNNSKRLSNIELGRVIAMSMILILHFCTHGGLIDTCYKGLVGLTIYGVDIFVLISGIFLIKLKWQSILKLAFIVLGFEILTIALSLILIESVGSISRFDFVKIFIAPLSGSRYWFIQVYFILMILSPLLNTAIRSLDWCQFRRIMLILTFANIYSCNLIGNHVDEAGYNIFNFIYLYLLGYFITHDDLIDSIKDKWILILVSVCITLSVFLAYHAIPIYYPFGYSSATTIIVSASIVLLLYRHPFNNSFVNQLGSCSLGAYLLQDGFLGYNFIYDFQKLLISKGEIVNYLLFAAFTFFSYWLIAWVFMKCLNLFIPKLSCNLNKRIDKIVSLTLY